MKQHKKLPLLRRRELQIGMLATGISSVLLLNAGCQSPSAGPQGKVPFEQIAVINVTDPVDIKWAPTSNVYVLSGSTATITEYDAKQRPVRTLAGIGSKPTGLDVDAAGNVYVAMSGANQVWKFKPTTSSFEPDSTFGSGGFIGNKDGSPGSNAGEFKTPFAIAGTFDGEGFYVTDSENNRIQGFTKNGKFAGLGTGRTIPVTGSNPNPIEGFKEPKGIVRSGNFHFFIIDAGNNRLVIGGGLDSLASHGKSGAAMGQFQSPINLTATERGICVADAGNNRVQIFNPIRKDGKGGIYDALSPRVVISSQLGLKQPNSVAWTDDPLEEKLWIADTGNNRLLLLNFPLDNPEAVWKAAQKCLRAGDINGSLRYYSGRNIADTRRTFLDLGKEGVKEMANRTPGILPLFIGRTHATYRLNQTNIVQKVEFIKENGMWKIYPE